MKDNMRTKQLIADAKVKASISSDYALSNLLGVSRQVMSHWTNGRELPNTLGAVKLAEVLGREPIEVIAEIEIERATRANKPELANQWRAILAKTATGFTGLFLTGSLLLAPPPVNASSSAPMKPLVSSSGPLYIMSTRKRGRDRRKRGVMAAMARTLASFSKHRPN